MMLDPAALQAGLRNLPDWQREGQAVVRTFQFADFAQAMAFVNRVADLAERAGHHPDLDIRYNRVRVALSTHDAGGVTARDLDLARQISAIESR